MDSTVFLLHLFRETLEEMNVADGVLYLTVVNLCNARTVYTTAQYVPVVKISSKFQETPRLHGLECPFKELGILSVWRLYCFVKGKIRFLLEFLWMILMQTSHCEKGIKVVMCIVNMNDTCSFNYLQFKLILFSMLSTISLHQSGAECTFI